MPKRISTRRFESAAAQGDDSYLIMRVFTWGEEKAFRKALKKENITDEETINLTLQAIADHLAEWNWVDDAGQAMPMPKAPGDFDMLNDSEMLFLKDCLEELFAGVTESERKN